LEPHLHHDDDAANPSPITDPTELLTPRFFAAPALETLCEARRALDDLLIGLEDAARDEPLSRMAARELGREAHRRGSEAIRVVERMIEEQ
jgi:hypothetical protein